MVTPRFTVLQHVSAVACVVLVSVVMHGVMVLSGVGGPAMQQVAANHTNTLIALPVNLR